MLYSLILLITKRTLDLLNSNLITDLLLCVTLAQHLQTQSLKTSIFKCRHHTCCTKIHIRNFVKISGAEVPVHILKDTKTVFLMIFFYLFLNLPPTHNDRYRSHGFTAAVNYWLVI